MLKELVDIRKTTKILSNTRITLVQIELILIIHHNLGDIIVTKMPTIILINNLKSSLVKFMPNVNQEINQIAQMLDVFMIDSFSTNATFRMDETMNSESE